MRDLLGKAHDPAFWAEVREGELYRPLRDSLLSRYETEGRDAIPALP